MPQHSAGRLEACADHQQHRVRAPVPVPRAKPRGPTQQGGGRGAHLEPPPVRAERPEGNAGRLRGRHLLRPLPQVMGFSRRGVVSVTDSDMVALRIMKPQH